jgi:hypothetical protein
MVASVPPPVRDKTKTRIVWGFKEFFTEEWRRDEAGPAYPVPMMIAS